MLANHSIDQRHIYWKKCWRRP